MGLYQWASKLVPDWMIPGVNVHEVFKKLAERTGHRLRLETDVAVLYVPGEDKKDLGHLSWTYGDTRVVAIMERSFSFFDESKMKAHNNAVDALAKKHGVQIYSISPLEMKELCVSFAGMKAREVEKAAATAYPLCEAIKEYPKTFEELNSQLQEDNNGNIPFNAA